MTGLPVVQPRTCGSCVACCVHLDIEELQKPAGVVCPKLSGDGCSIYHRRPMPCRDYRCAWIDGIGGDEHRPDRLGVILHRIESPLGGGMMAANEIRARALDPGTEALQIILQIGARFPVHVRRHDGRLATVIPHNLSGVDASMLTADERKEIEAAGAVLPGADRV